MVFLALLALHQCSGLSRDLGADDEQGGQGGQGGGGGGGGAPRRGLGGLGGQGEERNAGVRGGRRLKMKLDEELDDGAGGGGGGGNGAGGGAGAGADGSAGGGAVEVSVARVEAAARAIGQSHDPLKLLFGLALLLYGRSFPHLILFTHAFKISGWPMLLSASQKMGVGYASITKGANKAHMSAVQAFAAALHPELMLEALRGVHYGLVSCLASVVSPVAGAAGVGLSLGQSVDRHVQPLLTKYVATDARLAQLAPRPRLWAEKAVDHAPELLSMVAALSSMGIVNLLSGCLLGAQLVVDVGLVYAQHQLRRFALRSDHALLHKVAANFNPKHAAAGGVSYVVALMGLASQLRRGAGPLSFPIKVVSVCFFFVCLCARVGVWACERVCVCGRCVLALYLGRTAVFRVQGAGCRVSV